MDPNSDSEGEGEETDKGWENKEWGGVSGRVILIDVSGSDEQLLASLSATYALLRRMLINSPSHLLGLALYATKSNDDRGLENVVQIFELKQPTIDEVLVLKNLCSDIQHVRKTWGAAQDYNFEHALWQASRMFSHCKKKKNSQTVTILSNFSEPDPSNHRTILKRASDLISYDIDINLINVSERSISDKSFYAQLGSLISKDSNDEWEPPIPLMSVEDILPLIWQNTHKKSASAKLKFHLGDDVVLGVGLYHLCKAKNLPKKILLCQETNERVESSVLTYKASDETARPILNAELCMYQKYGDRNIELSYGELMQLRKFGGAPCIKLLGFKPSSILSMTKLYLKPCAFLYPEEDTVTGSNRLFQCLRDRCIAKDRIAICLMVSRWYSHPRLVALVPQKQIIENGRQLQHDGFHVIYLPYLDNMKDLTVDERGEVSDEQLKCMYKIMKKLKINYSPDTFENPKLQTFYNSIEALALEDESRKICEDTTQPDLDMQENRISNFIEDFNNLFGPFGVTPVKRKCSNENGAASKRKPKEPVECPDLEMLAARVTGNDVGKYTVEQLKQILKWRDANKAYGIALTGLKKGQLVNLVYQYCSDM